MAESLSGGGFGRHVIYTVNQVTKRPDRSRGARNLRLW